MHLRNTRKREVYLNRRYITAAMREFLRMAGAKKVDGVCPGKDSCKIKSDGL